MTMNIQQRKKEANNKWEKWQLLALLPEDEIQSLEGVSKEVALYLESYYHGMSDAFDKILEEK